MVSRAGNLKLIMAWFITAEQGFAYIRNIVSIGILEEKDCCSCCCEQPILHRKQPLHVIEFRCPRGCFVHDAVSIEIG